MNDTPSNRKPAQQKQALTDTISIHGLAVSIDKLGILILGKSGIGKSDLALSLIDRGHKLIADDLVTIQQLEHGLQLLATANTAGFLHLRGIGIINSTLTYPNALVECAPLNLVVQLMTSTVADVDADVDASKNSRVMCHTLLGHTIDKIILPVTNNRPLVLLLETLVRSWWSRKNGYNASAEFEQLLTNNNEDTQ